MSFLNKLKKVGDNTGESLLMLAEAQDLADKYLGTGDDDMGPKDLEHAGTCKIIMLAALEVISRVPWELRLDALRHMTDMIQSSMKILKDQLIFEAVENALQQEGILQKPTDNDKPPMN